MVETGGDWESRSKDLGLKAKKDKDNRANQVFKTTASNSRIEEYLRPLDDVRTVGMEARSLKSKPGGLGPGRVLREV